MIWCEISLQNFLLYFIISLLSIFTLLAGTMACKTLQIGANSFLLALLL